MAPALSLPLCVCGVGAGLTWGPRLDPPQGREAYRLYREAELLEGQGHADQASALFRKAVKTSSEMAGLLGL
jgi:hypothetical protein